MLRVPLFVIAALLLATSIRVELLLSGFLISLVGEFIQLWCFASLAKKSTLAIRGPYTLVRNPMYLGRYCMILGFLVTAGFWPVLVVFTILYWFYMAARVAREEMVLTQIFGEDYRQYCKTTRRFVPGIPNGKSALACWNWALFKRNHGIGNLAIMLFAWIMLAGWCLYENDLFTAM